MGVGCWYRVAEQLEMIIIGMLSGEIEGQARLRKVITSMMEIFLSGLLGLAGQWTLSVDNKN